MFNLSRRDRTSPYYYCLLLVDDSYPPISSCRSLNEQAINTAHRYCHQAKMHVLPVQAGRVFQEAPVPPSDS